MAHGFSERSMRAQEGIIGGYVDQLVRGLRGHCFGESGTGGAGQTATMEKDQKEKGKGEKEGKQRQPVPLNMVSWYNWTTFDVIGDLAFGEPFGCLEKAEYDPWVDAIGKSVRFGTILVAIRLLGLENLMMPIVEKLSDKDRRFHRNKTMDKLQRRVDLTKERPDFLEGLLQKREEWVSSVFVFLYLPLCCVVFGLL